MSARIPALVILITLLLLTACAGQEAAELPTAMPAPTLAATVETAVATVIPAATQSPVSTRVGADYIFLLPRESAVPAGWAMNPGPDFETRSPQPGDTYHFACLDLPARSVGQASVGYRSLEGLPSVHIEYVIYPTAGDAADALADMQQATESCAKFTIGEGEGAVSAAFAPLDFPAYGDAGFAAALTTDSTITGELVTHMVKVRNGHVVIGISHANYAGQNAPDAALTESLVALAVTNLEGGPGEPGQ